MKVVILAAGRGSRLGELTKDRPKCLLELNEGFTILDYQIHLLVNELKIEYSDIYVVVGYQQHMFKHYEQQGINLIKNEFYDRYENMFSLYLALKEITTDFILLNSDTLFHRRILDDLLDNNIKKSSFVVDNVQKLSEESMKVIIQENRILKFGKDIDINQADGEYIGLATIQEDDIYVIYDKLDELIKRGRTNLWYEEVLNELTDEIILRPVYTHGLPWIEIDTVEDYLRAKKIIGGMI